VSNVVGTGIGEQDGEQVILIFGRHKLFSQNSPLETFQKLSFL
jgi:hypothetical protein